MNTSTTYTAAALRTYRLFINFYRFFFRQFQDARRNSPLRHILPIGDDQPPPYSERQDSVDGGLAEVVTEPNAPKRQSETPPPSYEEALYR